MGANYERGHENTRHRPTPPSISPIAQAIAVQLNASRNYIQNTAVELHLAPEESVVNLL